MARILVIDDEEGIRVILCRALERVGYEVLEAADGDAGLFILQSEAVDLVITDVVMPNRDGFEVVRHIKEHKPGIKLIAISGGGHRIAMNFLPIAERFGADRSFSKPFRPRNVVAAVEELLGANTSPN